MISLDMIPYEDKSVLQNLMQLYLYDFSEFTGDDVNAHGRYEYMYLDNYWIEERRDAYFIRYGESIAGFTLITRGTTDVASGTFDAELMSISEFFVMRKFRRRGIGAFAANLCFDRYPGDWQITTPHNNKPSATFWRAVIDKRTSGNFVESRTPTDIIYFHFAI
ncbi:MAG: GNAT family N-acetyltransferase [Chloroflexi bacterium]|nr:GNAT family N-acetyltransferase [Chloroflexota bacterium]